MKRIILMLLLSAALMRAQVQPPKPYGAVPSKQQIEWHKMEFYAFVHFNMDTFTGREWGLGTESPDLFNPTDLDCRQWAKVVKDAGMKGIILTAKHHDGFCLWPSEYSTHTVRESKWKNGKGDVVKELENACKQYGLKMGIYVSPWDRNHPTYGSDAYNRTFINTLTEVLTNYGKIFEVWFDGANGEGPNGKKQTYDWPAFFKTVKTLQPDALIFGPVGSDIRWVGNEDGYAGETNWNTMDNNMTETSAGLKLLNSGYEGGNTWRPAEVDVSIRPGWYYHQDQDDKVKSLSKLVDIYFASVGRGANLLLNIPPDRRGLINEHDIKALKEFRNYLNGAFKRNLAAGARAEASNVRGNSKQFSPLNTVDKNWNSCWATDDNVTAASIEIKFKKKTTLNCVEIQEYIPLGQRVKSFSVEAYDGGWNEIARGTTIGYKRLLRFPEVKTNKIRVNILESKACPVISNIAVYKIPELVIPPVIKRSKKGIVKMYDESPQAVMHFTTDGSQPDKNSPLYTGPFEMKGACVIKAKAFTSDLKKASNTVTAEFGVSKENWKIIYADDEHPSLKAENAIDDDPSTFWHTHWDGNYKKHPHEIVIDLGESLELKGFTYLPRQDGSGSGDITGYELYLSGDNKEWKQVVKDGRFGNIANNPILQTVYFDKPEKARFLKLVTNGDANNNGWVNAAEISVITR